MSENTQRPVVDGLPKQFVSSLKVLFDILDEDRSGYIRLVDVESRWNGEGVRGLPVGVIEALRKVTPHSGLLSFDRFVMGLKLAMFKSKHNHVDYPEDNRRTPTNEFQNIEPQEQQQHHYQQQQQQQQQRGGEGDREVRGGGGNVGVIQLHHLHPTGQGLNQPGGHSSLQSTQRTYGTAITATVRPNNAINIVSPVPPSSAEERQHRVPLSKSSGNTSANIYSSSAANSHTGERDRYISPPPPRPKRHPLNTQHPLPTHAIERARSPQDNALKGPPQVPPRDYRKSAKSVIISELKQWQKTRLRNNEDVNRRPHITSVSSDSRLVDKKSNPNYDIYVNVEELPTAKSEEQLRDGRPTSKVQARRREPRRHTVANGVDYNMVKRMKQLEEERDMLRQGLELLDAGRDWYHRQMTAVEVKQRNFSSPSSNDISVEDYQIKLTQQRAYINELNQRIKALISSSEQGIPGHMNLAVKSVPYSEDTITINMLKEQNRQLTKEVGQKGERITKLEREKASLIREMFEVRAHAKNKSHFDDTTFM